MKKKIMTVLATGLFALGMASAASAGPINIATLGAATQSSTMTYDKVTGYASNAIDGITDTSWNYSSDANNSITHTDKEFQSWWQVKLDQSYKIDSLTIWNREDNGHSTRLDDFNIYIFNSTTNSMAWSNLNTSTFAPTMSIDLDPDVTGDIVRIQLNGTNYLHLAEVEVYGTTPAPVPLPGAVLLFGSGLAGLVGLRRKKE